MGVVKFGQRFLESADIGLRYSQWLYLQPIEGDELTEVDFGHNSNSLPRIRIGFSVVGEFSPSPA